MKNDILSDVNRGYHCRYRDSVWMPERFQKHAQEDYKSLEKSLAKLTKAQLKIFIANLGGIPHWRCRKSYLITQAMCLQWDRLYPKRDVNGWKVEY